MSREDLLAEKAQELRNELSAWAQTEHLLSAGEELFFSLRIVKTGRLVRRDPGDDTGFRISAQCRNGFSGTFLRPATMTSALCDAILARMPSGKTRTQMHELLVENANAPVRLHMEVGQKANAALRKHFSGTHYRLALGKENGSYCAQLWEVSYQ